MAEPLAGRVALVTGAGRGLGRAYALALARLGCAVAVNSLPRAEGATAEAVVSEIRGEGGKASACLGSFASPTEARDVVEATAKTYGGLDILIVNAGVVLNRPFLETSDEDLQAMFDLHLAGPFAAVRQALPGMIERGWGRIVLTGSGSAAFGLENQAAYAAIKAAMIGLNNVLAIEFAGTGVLSNVVLPVAPPLGRTPASARIAALFAGDEERLEPDWVAPLVTLLASDSCPGPGGVYSAVAGRYAKVFPAVAAGWIAEGAVPPGLGEMARRSDAMMSATDLDLPPSIMAEIEAVAHRRPAKGGLARQGKGNRS